MPTLPPNHTGVTRFITGAGAATFATSPISFQNNAPWTIELWCSLDALVDSMPMVSKGTEFTLASKGAMLFAALGGEPVPLQSQALLMTGMPYYICAVYDGATMSLYLNGALAAQGTASADPPATGTPLTVGGGFYGEVQGLRIWTQAMNANILGQNQFNAFPAGTPNLATQIDFTVTPPVDTSVAAGPGLVPTLNAGAAYVPFVPAALLGTSSFCDPYNDGAVNPGGSQAPFSIAAWIRPEIHGQNMYIFTNGVQESNSGVTFGINSSGNLSLQIGDSTILGSQAILTDEAWVHVAATWSPSTGTLYVNGVQDSSASTMTLAGSLATGEPLVGAIASTGTQLPISSFDGQIQSVCIWNVALTAQQVANYQTASPQTDPACVAYYDLSQPPAQNQISFNPIGLVAGATLAPAPSYSGRLGLSVGAAQRLAAPRARPPAAPLPSLEDEAFLKAADADFAEFLQGFALTEAQRVHFRERHGARLREGRDDFLAGAMADFARVRIDDLGEGLGRMVYVHPDGREEIISDAELDPCTLWCISLVTAIAGALWLALGLAYNYPSFLTGMTNFFGTRINTIGIMPQLTALFQNGVTSQGIYAALKLLHEYSLLTAIAKLSYQIVFSSLSWWTILALGMRIVLLMSPGAALEIIWLVSQLAYSIYSINQLIGQRPAGCPS